MPELDKLEQHFLDTLAAMGKSVEKIVVVGGWCPYVYAHYLWNRYLPGIPTTLDIDLGVMETGVVRYSDTVYDILKKARFDTERIYEGEAEPIEFVCKRGIVELKLEFITSFQTSDDTLNRFLGKALACNRIEAFEILLDNPDSIEISHLHRKLKIKIPNPATFLFHKGISFVMRSDEYKLGKDLFYLYFILKYHPDRFELFQRLKMFRENEYFLTFIQNLHEYVDDYDQAGYAIIRNFLRDTVDSRTVNKEIRMDFLSLFEALED